MPGHRSSAVPLAWMYAALIVYASLYPFADWRLPGESPWAFLTRPWWQWWTAFDLVSNLLGYLPLGALVFGALVRSGWRWGSALALAVASGASLSFATEAMQNFLPYRVPSNVDLALNGVGTALGALLGLLVHALGGVERWQAVRERWFIDRSAGGLALLVLWPWGLLFPAAVPLGLGQVLPRLRETLAQWVQGTPVQEWTERWLPADPLLTRALSPGSEFVAIAFGLLGPCLLAFAVSRPGWRRLLLALGAGASAFAATALSTALNFGPQHWLAWGTRTALSAMAGGLALALLLAWVPRRAAAALGLLVLGVLVTLVAQAPADAYFAASLQAWEQGRFVRFHGAAQWVGWLWPYAAMAYLLMRVAAREPSAAAS